MSHDDLQEEQVFTNDQIQVLAIRIEFLEKGLKQLGNSLELLVRNINSQIGPDRGHCSGHCRVLNDILTTGDSPATKPDNLNSAHKKDINHVCRH